MFIIWLIVFSITAGFAVYLYFQNRYLKYSKSEDIYMKTLIQNLPIGLYFRDIKGKILLANVEFSKITGIPADSICGKNIFDIYSSMYIEDIIREDGLSIKTGNSVNVERVISFPQSEHCYRILKTPMFGQNKEVVGFVVFLSNIDKAKETESSKQSFVATLTHDLKTPTNAQLSTLNMLLKGMFGKLNAEQTQMITLTKDSCQYMSDLIATIMDTYNSDYGEIELKQENFDIEALLEEVCESSRTVAQQNGQTIEIKTYGHEFHITADKLQIKRVIVNLLSNALTYGYPNCPIYIALETSSDGVDIHIENKSKQIPESELKTIFDKFKKTKFAHFNKTGTGLGLYLARQVVKRHNGKIYAKSYENGTCIFGFTLPLTNKNMNENSTKAV